MEKRIAFAALLLAGALACPAWAQHADHHAPAQASGNAAPSEPIEGEIVAVEPQNHRVKIRHGEIKSLNMAPMSAMPFNVRDDALLGKLKPGSKIRFTAGRIDGAYVLLTAEEVR